MCMTRRTYWRCCNKEIGDSLVIFKCPRTKDGETYCDTTRISRLAGPDEVVKTRLNCQDCEDAIKNLDDLWRAYTAMLAENNHLDSASIEAWTKKRERFFLTYETLSWDLTDWNAPQWLIRQRREIQLHMMMEIPGVEISERDTERRQDILAYRVHSFEIER